MYHQDVHLPNTGSVIAFSLRGECRIEEGRPVPPVALTGLHETLRAHEHRDGHTVLLAQCTPVGAAVFLRPSLSEFAGTTTDLAEVVSHPQDLTRLYEQLIETTDNSQRVRLGQDFLLARIGTSLPDPLVTAAVDYLETGRGARRIDELTQYVGLSQSALERRFRRVVGVSPKRFASLLRLQHVVQLRASGADLTAIAHVAGYFDQSHFIKEFRRATDSSPDAFFRQVSAQ